MRFPLASHSSYIVDNLARVHFLAAQDLNIRFHSFFAEIADHQRLRIMLLNLTAQMRRLSYQAFMDKDHMRRSNLEHEHILEAIRKGNKQEALKLTRLHMEKVSRRHKAIAAQST